MTLRRVVTGVRGPEGPVHLPVKSHSGRLLLASP